MPGYKIQILIIFWPSQLEKLYYSGLKFPVLNQLSKTLYKPNKPNLIAKRQILPLDKFKLSSVNDLRKHNSLNLEAEFPDFPIANRHVPINAEYRMPNCQWTRCTVPCLEFSDTSFMQDSRAMHGRILRLHAVRLA